MQHQSPRVKFKRNRLKLKSV